MHKSIPLRSAGIFALPNSFEQASTIATIIKKLHHYNFSVFVCNDTKDLMGQHGLSLETLSLEDNFDSVDFVMSLGGDGTVLKAAHLSSTKNKPIIGINAGRLGFLADAKKEDIDTILLDLKTGHYFTEERTLLESEIEDHPKRQALNEISIQKQGKASLLTIQTYINCNYLSSFWADGIIISTPTGSTAYSLSVGGPIISPASKVFIINPIAPHTLTVRPIIIPDNSHIVLKITGRDSDYIISHDSNLISFQKELEINISKAGYTAKFIKFNNYNYYSTLRQKLMWGADIRN